MTRKIVFWTHLVIGVAAGVAILVMSVTGVLLAFERQILQFVDRDLRSVAVPADARPRPLAEMLRTVAASRGAQPGAIVVRPGPSSAVELSLGREGSVFVDPYTGAILGEGSKQAREVFGAVERVHRTLGEPLRSRGPLRAFGAASNLVFLLLALSGPYLWLPRRWSWAAVRSGAIFRPGLRGRARDWNWHNSVGLWCALPLVLITATGVVMSYPWANALLFRLARSPCRSARAVLPAPAPRARAARPLRRSCSRPTSTAPPQWPARAGRAGAR
ncbi:MAG: PepSY-associated TM helix domain-containing protein [Vicinamibacteria bacterium]